VETRHKTSIQYITIITESLTYLGVLLLYRLHPSAGAVQTLNDYTTLDNSDHMRSHEFH